MNKEFHNATVRELEDWPGVTFTEEDGGKHDKLVLHFNGKSCMIVVAKTPSDVRALPNHLAVMRRVIRGLGAVRAQVLAGKTKRAPSNPVLREVPKLTEKTMTSEAKLTAIFRSIGDLRYSEMLHFAEVLRDTATEINMQRGNTQSWASMLQCAVDGVIADAREQAQAKAA